TAAGPAGPGGVMAVSWVAERTVTVVAVVPPMVTLAPAWKFVPLRVSAVPPAVGPLAGFTALSVGGGAVKPRGSVRGNAGTAMTVSVILVCRDPSVAVTVVEPGGTFARVNAPFASVMAVWMAVFCCVATTCTSARGAPLVLVTVPSSVAVDAAEMI